MSPSGCFHTSVCRLPVSHFERASLISCFHSVCRLQVVFMRYVAFRLFSQRLSPLGCFYSVCRFHSSFMVSFIFCNPFSVHSACRLKVSGISSFKRFQTSFYNVLCPHFFIFVAGVALKFPQPL